MRSQLNKLICELEMNTYKAYVRNAIMGTEDRLEALEQVY